MRRCRLCLADAGEGAGARLAPIFPRARLHARYTAALFLTTGLQIEMEDGLPQTICWECTDLINSALLLRNQSHRAEVTLVSLGYRRSEPAQIIQKQCERHTRDKQPVLSNIRLRKNKSITNSHHRKHACQNDGDLSKGSGFKTEIDIKEESGDYLRVTQLVDDEAIPSNGDATLSSDSTLNVPLNDRSEVLKTDLLDIVKQNELYEKLRRYSGDDINLSPGSTSDHTAESNVPRRELTSKSNTKPVYTLKEKRDALLSLVEEPFDPNGPVRCKVCKKTVSRWSSFRTHSKLHLGFDFVCEYCGKSFISITQLRRHKSSQHGEERTLACARCGYKALDKPQLILHERRQHTGERPYVCDACGASYYSRRCLIQHIENHNTARNIQCDKCPSMFKSRRHLARHTYTMHTSKKYNYKCHVCQQIYKKLKYVRQHMLKMHGLTTAQQGQITKIRLQ